jgi:hypothetical protein
VKKKVRLPLFAHITRVPERGELRSKGLEWLDIWEGRTFRHFPTNKHDEDQESAKMEFIALIMCFMVVQFNLIN